MHPSFPSVELGSIPPSFLSFSLIFTIVTCIPWDEFRGVSLIVKKLVEKKIIHIKGFKIICSF
jgi:hypothetical protein